MEQRTSFLVVGLGNPGPDYALSRHNIGFLAVDFIAARQNLSFSKNSLLLGEWSTFALHGARIVLLKPQTYMNRSGQSVWRAASSEQLPIEGLVVIHDDLDLDFGRVKIVFNRGAGGHNGVRSIIEEMSERNFVRIKCGIGRPPSGEPVIDYVLSPFLTAEQALLPQIFTKIEQAVTLIVGQGKTAAMNEINNDSRS